MHPEAEGAPSNAGITEGPFEIQPLHTMYMTEDFIPKIGMRNTGKCTMCGNNDLEMETKVVGGNSKGDFFLSRNHWLVYVCSECGYSEFYKKKIAIKKKEEKKKAKSKKVSGGFVESQRNTH